jgi:hypothetical protein
MFNRTPPEFIPSNTGWCAVDPFFLWASTMRRERRARLERSIPIRVIRGKIFFF